MQRYIDKLLRLAAITLTGLSAGCTHLPSGGPNHLAIDREAVASISYDKRAIVSDYVLLDISPLVVDHVIDVGPESFFRTFGTGRGRPTEILVGVGDVLSVSIFESSAGGLFTPGDVANRPGNFVTLPPQTVNAKGNITVPFAGSVKAAGRSVDAIQKSVETQLANRAIEPQVLIALPEQAAAEVAVFGDATGNGKFRLRNGSERILDVISRTGLRVPGHETFVTLQRNGRRATVYFPRLIKAAEENIFVRPGDIIYAYRDPQRIVAVGALGSTTQTQGITGLLQFDSERLSLVEAVAKAGGLLDTRANAGQVFVYRMEYRHILEHIGLNLSRFDPAQKLIPTIYRANYRDPSVFFFADQFPMRHKDVIYVANADSIEVDKFFSYVRAYTGFAAGVTGDIRAVSNNIRGP
jgi:polysaccharide biosynthesis/export protein